MSTEWSATDRGYTAADELRRVVDKAEELLDGLGDDTDDAAMKLRSRVNDTVRNARARLADLEASSRDMTRRAADTADEYVTDHPWTAVAMAAAIGAVAGAVLSRRH